MINLRHEPRARRENVVPMINVSFLLLVFFLLTAAIAPPPPFELAPPEATGAPTEDGVAVYLSPTGALVFQDGTTIETDGLAQQAAQLHVSASLDASKLARAIGELRAMGVSSLTLVATLRSAE